MKKHDEQREEQVDEQEAELNDDHLEEVAGGYHDDGSGDGCIPNPLDTPW